MENRKEVWASISFLIYVDDDIDIEDDSNEQYIRQRAKETVADLLSSEMYDDSTSFEYEEMF